MGSRKLIHDSLLVLVRCGRETLRKAHVTLLAPGLLAVLIVLIFRAVYGDIAKVSGYPVNDFIDWVAPAAILLSVFLSAGFNAASLMRDIETGYMERLRLLPGHAASSIIGRVALDMLRAIPPAAGVLVVSLLLGATNDNGLRGAVAVLGLCALLAAAWNGIFYAAVLKTRNVAVIQGLQPLMFMPAVMFSTFWVPVAFMPGWYSAIARHNPVTPIIDAARSIMLGATDWRSVWISLAVMMLLAAATYGAAGREFARAIRQT